MSCLRCRICKRANPPEALYCHHDGAALDATGRSKPIAVGARPFHAPFVFPSGRRCRSFDELVLACEDDWEGTKAVLRKGYLAAFLEALGRPDLAEAARYAVASSDPDRALDDFLSDLPSTVRAPAKLQVQPAEMNLGQLACGSYRRFTVAIENLGMGLIHGSVSCPGTPWLTVGDKGDGRKLIRCRNELTVTVQVVGKALRAGEKPLRGRIVVETNGGTVEIPASVTVPATPFPTGVLAGAQTPRQLAEKARTAPKQAAPLFANGAVSAWYSLNGWTYPVQGPSATGLGGVQQFFEALGLVSPPRVEVNSEHLYLQGGPGGSLEAELEVRTTEKRPVFAHAVSSAPWLQVGRTILAGRTARIPLRVASVPALPGETLDARVEVTANGNQRFVVEVTLDIAGLPPPPGVRLVELTDAVPPLVAVEIPALPVIDLEKALDGPSVPGKPVHDGDYHKEPPPRRRP